jgi:3',5'-cyclic AMP phosphodiesterase CpdA
MWKEIFHLHKPLRFRQDGSFTIAQFTDIHWKNGGNKDQLSRNAMNTVLDAERPDLVVFTGDTIYMGPERPGEEDGLDPRLAFRDAVDAVESRGISWAYVFGNHDTEWRITREELIEHAAGFPHTVTEAGPAEIDGFGNYVLEIVNADGCPGAALFLMDSGQTSSLPNVRGYGWIRRSQIDWFARRSEALPKHPDGRPIPGLAFFHIPLPEYNEVWDKSVCYGHKYEKVCCPEINSGMFAAMAEAGHIMGTFVGHDHINDYWGELHGIRLCYGRATGHNTYGKEDFPRGARIIRLQAGERKFDTWIRLETGAAIMTQPMHTPENES